MTMQLSLQTLAKIVGCETKQQDVMVTGAVIDSRAVTKGCLFVALAGEHVDGHDYLEQARQAGAAAALVSRLQESDLPQLVVEDVTLAFGLIARYWREQCATKVIAITGSNGKTTVKEMTASILAQQGTVIATQGNLNNQLGVPLTLMRLDKTTDFAVIEMGASQQGDIAYLVTMATPQVALVNNVSAAHLEGFGDLQGVATAKGEIYAGLADDGIAIVNHDLDLNSEWQYVLASQQQVSFALEGGADITANSLELTAKSSYFMVKVADEFLSIHLPLPGLHNIANALAAIAVTSSLNIKNPNIIKGLQSISAVPHRLQLRTGFNQSQLIDDSYNANPASYHHALAVLSSFAGHHYLVLADFGELGDDSVTFHAQMGLDAKQAGVQRLFTLGQQSHHASQSFGEGAQHFDDMDSLADSLKQILNKDTVCLIKGSRFMQLDKLADQLAIEGEV